MSERKSGGRRLDRLRRWFGAADRAAVDATILERGGWLSRRLALRREAAEAEQMAAVFDATEEVSAAESDRLDALKAPPPPATKEHWDIHRDSPSGFGRGWKRKRR